MKALTGGNEKFRYEYNKINKKSYWHIISYMT
jgi:hypothetical protein